MRQSDCGPEPQVACAVAAGSCEGGLSMDRLVLGLPLGLSKCFTLVCASTSAEETMLAAPSFCSLSWRLADLRLWQTSPTARPHALHRWQLMHHAGCS